MPLFPIFQQLKSLLLKRFALILLLFAGKASHSQNLPSLLTGRNINATFSITAYDSSAQEWGIAVATNNIYVGNSTIYVQPGLGAFSVIAETEPAYAHNGFQQLQLGRNIREAIENTMQTDSESYLRQVAGIDRNGMTFAFTGASWKYEKGFAGTLAGPNFVAMGNQLAPDVLKQMSTAFRATTGTLAQRLLAAIVAGQKAGGQITGKQSAALVVKGSHNIWYDDIDLRVDDSKDPFGDLTRLLQYHYGRIRLNQATYALRMGNRQRGITLLAEAQEMIKGWNGLQSKVALAWLLLQEPAKAVATIRAAIKENPQWKENIPAFYILRDEPGMQEFFRDRKMSEKDWIAAVSLLDQLNRPTAEDSLCRKALQEYPASSYLYYLLGKTLQSENKPADAKAAIQKAVSLDPANAEAVLLLATMRP
jgi:uncharacterized Ntn-hydrolase superfamily protein